LPLSFSHKKKTQSDSLLECEPLPNQLYQLGNRLEEHNTYRYLIQYGNEISFKSFHSSVPSEVYNTCTSVSARKFYLRTKVAPEDLFRGQFFRKGANKLKATEGKNASEYQGK